MSVISVMAIGSISPNAGSAVGSWVGAAAVVGTCVGMGVSVAAGSPPPQAVNKASTNAMPSNMVHFFMRLSSPVLIAYACNHISGINVRSATN